MSARYHLRPMDPAWPTGLNELGSLPEVEELFCFGESLKSMPPCVAVVGTRRPTAAGLEAAEMFAAALAQGGFAVVSGLALGIDTAAHRAALAAGGQTIGVLGCGLDVDYPKANRRLKEEMAGNGAVVSEYPDGTQPHPGYFPSRNRIIAGLSLGVIVVEGAHGSGALITARQAIDANRSVWAVPGSIRNPMSAGPNDLIRTGQATLVTDPRHVFDELAPTLVWQQSEGAAQDLEPEERRMLALLDDVAVSLELLCGRLGLAQGDAAMELARMEVKGLVRRDLGGYSLAPAGARARAATAAAGAEADPSI